jgi:hypothetical protein
MCNQMREGQSCRSRRSSSSRSSAWCLTRDQDCFCAAGECIGVPFYRSWFFPIAVVLLIMIRLTTLLIRLNFADEFLSRLVTRKLKTGQKKKEKRNHKKQQHLKLKSTTIHPRQVASGV